MKHKTRWRVFYRSGLVSSLLAISLLLVQPLLTPLAVQGAEVQGAVNQNPSWAEINQKLEQVALEKDIPSVILKGIAYKESNWRQFDSQGNPLVVGSSSNPSIGIMQVTSYDPNDTETVERLKYDLDFNLRIGADILNQKWEMVPRIGDGDRNKLENWYLAIWAYNSWSSRNNPNQQTTGLAYQDKVLAIIADPAGQDARLSSYMEPVSITKLPAASLPATGVPERGSVWNTPEPVHFGDVVNLSYPEMQRLAGTNRIDTAIRQSKAGWPEGNSTVILARADDFPDALAGVPLAGYYDAPILLTSPQQLDPAVAQEIKRLNPEQIFLLGGEGALGAEISTGLAELGWDTTKQVRLSGKNRYETADSIARSLSAAGPVESVVLATGQNFPDALSVASAAGRDQMPILLTGKDSIPQSTLDTLIQLKPAQVYIIGGEGVISPEVEQQAATALGLSEEAVIRLGGSNRYATAARVAEEFGQPGTSLHLATGENFPDALSGAALAVHQQSMLILLPPDSLQNHPELQAYFETHWSNLNQVTVLGGAGVITDARTRELWLLGK